MGFLLDYLHVSIGYFSCPRNIFLCVFVPVCVCVLAHMGKLSMFYWVKKLFLLNWDRYS